MKFSIITATYNAAPVIRRTLDSIVKQSYKNFELLVIDGNSQDNTVEISRTYSKSIDNLVIVSEIDKGVYDAMNKGIAIAQGEYVFFLNAGDIFVDENVLEKIAKVVDRKCIYYGNAVTLRNGTLVTYRKGKFSKYRISHTNICHQTIFYLKKHLPENAFDLKYKLFADWVLNMKLWKRTKFKYINLDISVYEGGGMSELNCDSEFQKEQIKLIINFLGISAILYLFVRKTFNLING